MSESTEESEKVRSSLNDVQNQFKLKVGHRPHSMQQLLSFCNQNNIAWKFRDIKEWWPTRPEPEEKPQEAPINKDDYKFKKKYIASDNVNQLRKKKNASDNDYKLNQKYIASDNDDNDEDNDDDNDDEDNDEDNDDDSDNKEESENREPIKKEDSKMNIEAVIADKSSTSYSLTLSDDESINIMDIEQKDTVHDIEKDKKNEKKIIPKKALSDILNFNALYRIQKFLYFITYPLVWFLDIGLISNREWIQLPLLTYLISITRLIIAQTWVTLCIEGIIQYQSTATFYLLSYTFGMFIICLLLLYYLKDYTTKYHYIYFMELSTHMTGYGLLYFCVHIQYLWCSDELKYSWLFFICSLIIVCIVIIIIVFIKQFIFKVSMDNKISNEYLKYLKLYSKNNDDDDDETLSLINNTDIDIDFEMFKEEEIEMNSFWFTVLYILQNMWSIAIGLVLVECFVFIFVGYYVNLLVSWKKWQKTSIEHNLWEMIVFGFILAIITAFIQGIIELSCKKSCYSYVHNVDNLRKQTSVYKMMVFILNVLNDIESVWIDILSAGIGWALLTPNQAKTVWSQLEISIIGTICFVLFGLLSQKYNNKKHRDIFNEIQSVKNDVNIDNKEKILINKTRKLILFERMILIYNAAFAVSISNAWESFASLSLNSTYYRHLNQVGLFMVHLVYVVCITLIFIQLGLQLCDIKKQRLHEAINSLDASQ